MCGFRETVQGQLAKGRVKGGIFALKNAQIGHITSYPHRSTKALYLSFSETKLPEFGKR
jgi:hypothetical protein